jgi:ABC-type glycerol-3-phosphate transport system permease component
LRYRVSEAAGKTVLYVLLVGLSLLFLFPLFWMISTSLKTNPEVATMPPTWLPAIPQWNNYPGALEFAPLVKFAGNTLFICAVNVIGTVISCSMIAYGFARIRWPGRDSVFIMVLATMMIPGQVTMIPIYIIFTRLGWVNTFLPLTVPSFFGAAFYIFMLRQFFMTIPLDLDEAATLDGAGRLQILLRVILPLSRPALATIAIFTFWWTWNSFLDPLIYVSRQQHYTITLAMNTFNQQYARSAGYYDRILAGSVLTLLPMVIIFVLAQRQFIEGIQMQGLKQ